MFLPESDFHVRTALEYEGILVVGQIEKTNGDYEEAKNVLLKNDLFLIFLSLHFLLFLCLCYFGGKEG